MPIATDTDARQNADSCRMWDCDVILISERGYHALMWMEVWIFTEWCSVSLSSSSPSDLKSRIDEAPLLTQPAVRACSSIYRS